MSQAKISIYTNHITNAAPVVKLDLSDAKREDFHLAIVDGVLNVVSDGITDYKKVIQSHASEAGLVNILKLQTMRYGTLDNAIARNKEKQVFADVSNIPDSVAEQKAMVEKTNAEIDRLCKELGLSRDQLLNLTADKYVEIKKAQQEASAAAAAATVGGNE